MPRMSAAEFAAFEARANRGNQKKPSETDEPLESQIHRDISNECRRRGFLFLHGSTAHRTHRTLGEPDYVVLLHGGKSLMIEVKTRSGRVSEAQAEFASKARQLGHTVHLVRSFMEFLEIIREAEKLR